MRRRDFITGIAGSAASWPLAAWGQQPDQMPRIGALVGGSSDRFEAFFKTLAELGWVDHRNIRIDVRRSDGIDRIQAFAKELVSARPDLVYATTTPRVAAILKETRTIPVVFSNVSDPVGAGFVQNLPRPGGNATGFINIEASVGGKWVELLKDIAPQVSRVGLLFNPVTAPQMAYYRTSLDAAATSLATVIQDAPVHGAAEIETVFTTLAKDRNTGIIVLPDVSTSTHLGQIVAMAAQLRVPTVYPFGTFVKAGGLLSYGVDSGDLQRRAAYYVDRILKGAKPADLPVQLPTKFELAINLKTARALGLSVPSHLLTIADEVIE